jgi:Pyridoxamine 5'-phosphate oxidase
MLASRLPIRTHGRRRCTVAVVADAAGAVAWHELEVSAPEIARLGLARLAATRVALLGTLRLDRSPRISPVEPYLAGGELLIGVMASSAKAADLRRDRRYALHSAVTGPDAGEGELKLSGTASTAGPDLRSAPADAWWLAWPADKAIVFGLRIAHAAFVDWDLEGGLLTVHQWSPRTGYRHARRAYP